MPNKGWPDNGARHPSGEHDEGRQRESCYDVGNYLNPAVIADYLRNDLHDNPRSDSTGDTPIIKPHYPVDGNSNTGDAKFLPAAYPAGVPGSTV